MKIIPPYQITSEILNLINEAENYLILVSPYVNFNNWDRIKIDISNALKRNVRIEFYTRLDLENSKSWEQIEALGITPKLIKNLHAKLYFNEKSGIVTSMNLLTSSNLNAIEFGSIYNTDLELNELKTFVKKFLEPNIELNKPDEDDLYLAKEKFIIVLQNVLSKEFNKRIYCKWNSGNIEFNVKNQYYAFLDKVNNKFSVSGIISGAESERFKDFKEKAEIHNVKLLLNKNGSISAVSIKSFTSSNFDYLKSFEKIEIFEIVVNFVTELKHFKEYCYEEARANR